MKRVWRPRPGLWAVFLWTGLGVLAGVSRAAEAAPGTPPGGGDRSPVDLVLTPDGQWLVTANETSHTASLVRLASDEVVCEMPCGTRPSALALAPDGVSVLITARDSGDARRFRIIDGALVPHGVVRLGFDPRGVAVSPDGRLAYVTLSAAAAVAVVDLESFTEIARIGVGRWPRYLALSPDGTRLAVGASGDGGVSVVDTASRKLLYQENFVGLNLGQMHPSGDGRYVYFPWVAYGDSPITPDNIRRGWITASRIGRVRLDGKARREAIALDVRGQAVGDPQAVALSPDERWLAASAAGTHELLVYRAGDLPFQDYGGPGDHIDRDLLEDRDRFYRVPLGGRPLGLRFDAEGRRVYIANYLASAVQVVDLQQRSVERTIALGGPAEPSLARQGEAIFYDAARSLDQWYSCHTCHYEGGGNSVTMDTNNDGTPFTFKTVLSLAGAAETGPWTWHGWQTDFSAAIRKSMTDTLRGPEPTDADVQALAAYLRSLRPRPSPHLAADGTLDEAAARGRQIFHSRQGGCADCHSGPRFTDGQVHDVGLGSSQDYYQGFNTPSLIGVYQRVRLLHDGRARTLEEVLSGPHSPAKASGGAALDEQQIADLAAYLRTL